MDLTVIHRCLCVAIQRPCSLCFTLSIQPCLTLNISIVSSTTTIPIVATPLWDKCEGEAHTSQKWEVGVFRDSRKLRARFQGSNLLVFECSLCHWKGLEV
jgi:hypothetical protein